MFTDTPHPFQGGRLISLLQLRAACTKHEVREHSWMAVKPSLWVFGLCVTLLARLAFSATSAQSQGCGTLNLKARATQHCFPDDGKPYDVVCRNRLLMACCPRLGAPLPLDLYARRVTENAARLARCQTRFAAQEAIIMSAVSTSRQLTALPLLTATSTPSTRSSPSTAMPAATPGALAQKRYAVCCLVRYLANIKLPASRGSQYLANTKRDADLHPAAQGNGGLEHAWCWLEGLEAPLEGQCTR